MLDAIVTDPLTKL